jgi:hypothetical protein
MDIVDINCIVLLGYRPMAEFLNIAAAADDDEPSWSIKTGTF